MVHDLVDGASYMAHGYCLLWKPWLVVLHAGSDLLIFLAYFAIPVAIWIFLRQRKDLELRRLAILFAAFIFLCGLTHLLQMVTLWRPIYETQGVLKLATAIVSVATAVMIFPLIPKAIAIPSPRALQTANEGFKREIEAHEDTLGRLREARDELEKHVAERTHELEHSKARLEALITASAQIVWTTAADGNIQQDSPSWRAFTGQTYAEWKGTGWLSAVHPRDRAKTIAAWREAVEGRSTYDVEYRLQHIGGDYRWTSARGVPLLDESGNVTEWVGMNVDITDRKRGEEHAQLIMRELSHRTKNLLAVIASLARRTLDGSRDLKSQAEDFVERIHGLARSHDLLVRGDWRGVSLNDLVRSHLEPFGFDEKQVIVEGPAIDIKPEAAQSIGLALHELATNTTKHGALKTASGKLSVKWTVEPEDGKPTLKLEWLENSATAGDKPAVSGFGRLMLEKLVGASVSGRTEYEVGNRRVVWKLVAPLEAVIRATAEPNNTAEAPGT
jgi:PAS domain S-box-containing protein